MTMPMQKKDILFYLNEINHYYHNKIINFQMNFRIAIGYKYCIYTIE